MNIHFGDRRLSRLAVAGLVLGLAWAGLHPLSAQAGRNDDRFVATWATAVVARPQGPPAPGARSPRLSVRTARRSARPRAGRAADRRPRRRRP